MLSSSAPETGGPAAVRAGRLARFTVFSLLLVALAAALLAGPMARPARAEGTASSVDVQAQLGLDGVLKVTEKITFTGSVPGEVKQRFGLRQPLKQDPDRERVQQISGFTAKAGGSDIKVNEVRDNQSVTVTMPTDGATELELSYQVTGAVISADYGTTALDVAAAAGAEPHRHRIQRHRLHPGPARQHRLLRRPARIGRHLRFRRRRHAGRSGSDVPGRSAR